MGFKNTCEILVKEKVCSKRTENNLGYPRIHAVSIARSKPPNNSLKIIFHFSFTVERVRGTRITATRGRAIATKPLCDTAKVRPPARNAIRAFEKVGSL